MFEQAQEHCNKLEKNFQSIANEYGENMAFACKDIYFSLLTMHTFLMMFDSALERLVMMDVAAKATARVCELCEKAYGLTHDQTVEAMQMAKKIFSTTLEDVRNTADKKTA